MPEANRGTAGGPQTFEELQALLQSRYAALTQRQRRLADRVLSDPEGCAFLTVSEMAAGAGVNESTVVRFAAGLGLDGYPALARLCRDRLRSQAQLLSRFSSVEYLTGTDGDLLKRTAAFDQTNIARTLARVDPASWDGAIDILADAPRVHVIGLRKCYAVAYLLSYLLRLVRDEVRQLTLGAGDLTEELRGVRAGDGFVAISIHRYTRQTVRALEYARTRGARTVALTDNPASPLAPPAEVCLYVDTAGVTILRSLTAFVSLGQALVTGVAARLGAQTRSALRLEEELLQAFDTYEAEETGEAGEHPDGRPQSRKDTR